MRVVVLIMRLSVFDAIETIFGSVAGSEHPLLNHVIGDSFQIVRLSDERHALNEDRSQIDFPAEFGCAVVPREGVVVVVET